jgi:hypothetical protein
MESLHLVQLRTKPLLWFVFALPPIDLNLAMLLRVHVAFWLATRDVLAHLCGVCS